MVETKGSGVFVGMVMLVAGLGYLYMTASLPSRGVVDSGLVPYVLAFAMCGLGVLQIIVSIRRAPSQSDEAAAPEDTEPKEPVSYATVLMTLALMAAFTVMLSPLGFPIAAAIYLFLQFIVLTPADRKTRYLLYAVLAIVASFVIFVMFRYGFDLQLPAGILARFFL